MMLSIHITTIIFHIMDGLFCCYLDINSVEKTFIDGIIDNYWLLNNFLSWFYFVNKFISKIYTNKFTNKINTLNKKNYQYHFISNFISKYIISPTNKTVYNSINDFFYIAKEWNPINILLVAFYVIIFNSMEFYDGLNPSIIPSVMYLILF